VTKLSVDQALLKAKSHAKKGNIEEAQKLYQIVLQAFPDNKRAQQGLAALGGSKQTIDVQAPPQETINQLINIYNQGQLAAVIEQATSLTEQYPRAFIVWNVLGAACKGLGRVFEASKAFNKVTELNPNYADGFNNLGVTLQEQGQLEEAIALYEKALVIRPDYAEAYSNIGNALKEQDKLEEAIASYEKALVIRPHYVEPWSNGAEMLEKWSRLEQLDIWLERAFQAFEKVPSSIQFMKAKLLWRKKDFKSAFNLISDIDFETVTENRKQDYLNLKAKCYEKYEDFDNAHKCFSQSNMLAKKSYNYAKCAPETFFKALRDTLTKLRLEPIQTPIVYPKEETGFTPVFLVGFPRSGTTLLDTILRSHSKIEVLEEHPVLETAKALLRNNGYTDFINNIVPPKLLKEAKKSYEAEFYQRIENVVPESVFIDKLPLNLLQVPLIYQLYPQAKFILALRHPMDAILSCWMQNFKLNPATANMVELDRVVEFYCIAMDTFGICRAKYNLSVHEIRYEDLLENLTGETSALLKFLDLDWEAQMENYQKTALKRGRIYTPSYSQVIQPIYKEAKYRWLSYRKYLDEYVGKVKPWIDEFRYGER
jgi:tetratricopeptide (TPR) repeat protein